MLVFIAISVGLVSTWLLFHALLPLTERGTVTASEWERIEDESIRLLERRDLLIAELRDLEFEAALNKVGDKDLELLRARYEAEALDVVRQLDEQAEAYTDRIDTDVADRIAAAQAKRAAQQAEPVVPPKTKKPVEPVAETAEPVIEIADDAPAQSCPACDVAVQPDARFCDGCGTKLGAACGECGTRNRAEAKFCKRCGTGMELSA